MHKLDIVPINLEARGDFWCFVYLPQLWAEPIIMAFVLTISKDSLPTTISRFCFLAAVLFYNKGSSK